MRWSAARQVAIFGDYDVDGATSAALLASFLRRGGLDPLIHIPDRIFEGYGPNVEAIRSLAERGAEAAGDRRLRHDEPRAARRGRRGSASTPSSSIITRPTSELPDAVIVNPNRHDDLSELGHLAAVGLVFLTIVAVNRELRRRGFWSAARPEPDLLDFVDLVALGTVADVVPLNGAQPRLRRQGADRDAAARARRAHRADRRGAAHRSAGAVASRLHARPAHQRRRADRARRSRRPAAAVRGPFRSRRRSPPSSTASTASARRSSWRRSRKPRPRRWPRSASRSAAPRW